MSAFIRGERGVLFLLFFLCLALGRSAALELEGLPDLQILRLEGEALTGQAARELLEQEQTAEYPASAAVWGQVSHQTVENPHLGRSAPVTAVLLQGSSQLLFPASPPLLPEDREGCLIDEATAQALFGSPDPTGCPLQWAGRTLTLRGVIPSGRPLIALQAKEEDQPLDRLTLQAPEGIPLPQVLGEFQSRHGLSGLWTSTKALSFLAQAGSLLPCFLLLLSLVLSLIKTGFTAWEYPAILLLCLGAAGLLWFLTLWAAGFSLQIPTELLPGKWSDFDFWGELLAQKKSEFLDQLTAGKTELELEILLPLLRAWGWSLGAVLLSPLSFAKTAPKNGRVLWALCGGFAALCFLAAVKIDPLLARDRVLWICPPLFLGGAYGAKRLKAWVTAQTRPAHSR